MPPTRRGAAGPSGVERQVEYFEREADRLGHAPPVIDSADILRDPAVDAERLCQALAIPWDPAMLAMGPGIRADRRHLGIALV
jgi:hypothetical protein